MQFDFKDTSFLVRHKILNYGVTPRVIAWISSVNEKGDVNLSPYDFFAPMSVDPIIFSVGFFPKSNGETKDTFENIIRTKKASICMCNFELLPKMHQSAQEFDQDVSEAIELDIPLEIATSSYPPIPKGVSLAFMCDLFQVIKINKNSKILLLEAKKYYIDEKVFKTNFEFEIHNASRMGKTYQIKDHLIDQKTLKEVKKKFS